MIICRNCGKELSELFAGIHTCSNQPLSIDKYCNECGKLRTECLCGIIPEVEEEEDGK